jgi:olfactory receptor
MMPLLKISCTDATINFLLAFILAESIQVFTNLIVFASYTFVLFTILKKRSVKGIKKAFSTYGAHLLSVSLCYGTVLFMYVHPASPQADDQDVMDSILHCYNSCVKSNYLQSEK